DTNVTIPLEDQCSARRVEAGVELRKLAQSNGGRLQDERCHRELQALPFLLLAKGIQLSDICQVVLCHVGNRGPRQVHVQGRAAWNGGESLAVHLSPTAEIGQNRSRTTCQWSCGRYRASRKFADKTLHVFRCDSSVSTRPVYLLEINTESPSEHSGRWSGSDNGSGGAHRQRLGVGMSIMGDRHEFLRRCGWRCFGK